MRLRLSEARGAEAKLIWITRDEEFSTKFASLALGVGYVPIIFSQNLVSTSALGSADDFGGGVAANALRWGAERSAEQQTNNKQTNVALVLFALRLFVSL
jgi:hypothetical protein